MPLLFNEKLFQPGTTVVIGLSGGGDSVCLTHLLATHREQLGIKLIAAHLDHEWRATSAQDSALCTQLCTTLNIPLIIGKASQLNFTPHDDGSKESAGRQLRRHFFSNVAQEHNAQAITLAHHLNDQVETFFIRLIRGTTVAGLGCMKEIDGLYVRPLLHSSQESIAQYLADHKLAFIKDATNDSPDFLRNRIRHTVIPALINCDKRALNGIEQAIEQLQETETFLAQFTHAATQAAIKDDVVNVHMLHAMGPLVRNRLIVSWLHQHAPHFTLSRAFIAEIMRFLLSDRGGTHHVGPHWSIVKKNGKASIEKT